MTQPVWWSGRLPDRWRATRLKDVTELTNGFPFNSERFSDTVGMRLVRIRDLSGAPTLTRFDGEVPLTAVVEDGDLLVGMDGDFNAVEWSGGRAALNQRLCRLRARGGLTQRYLAYLIPLPLRFINDLTYATTVKHLSSLDLLDVRIPLPPPRLQTAIADFLDTETDHIDALISKKLSLVELLNEGSQKRQTEAACGRLGGLATRDSGREWLGRVPVHWPVERLKFIARLESGHTPSRSRPELWENCTTPWLTLNDVGYLESHEFIEETTNRISEDGLAASSARVVPAGTVVLSRDATVGRCGILARPMATSQHFVDWICSKRLLPRYLWLLFSTAMQTHFDSVTSGATLRTIGMSDVKQLVVPVPPLNEQHEIVAEAEEIRTRAYRGVGCLQRQLALLQERRQALITAAVTGELDIPGAA